MKKTRIIIAAVFSVAYAVALSLGTQSLLILLSTSVAVSLDAGLTAVQQYPRFIPFCVIVGILALGAVIALALSFLMVKPWEMLFEFLQSSF